MQYPDRGGLGLSCNTEHVDFAVERACLVSFKIIDGGHLFPSVLSKRVSLGRKVTMDKKDVFLSEPGETDAKTNLGGRCNGAFSFDGETSLNMVNLEHP